MKMMFTMKEHPINCHYYHKLKLHQSFEALYIQKRSHDQQYINEYIMMIARN